MRPYKKGHFHSSNRGLYSDCSEPEGETLGDGDPGLRKGGLASLGSLAHRNSGPGLGDRAMLVGQKLRGE